MTTFFEEPYCYIGKLTARAIAYALAEELGVKIEVDAPGPLFRGCFKRGSSKWTALGRMVDLTRAQGE